MKSRLYELENIAPEMREKMQKEIDYWHGLYEQKEM
jgi:hypothetical protein